MSHSAQGLMRVRGKAAVATALVSLAMWAAPAPAQEVKGECRLHNEGTAANGTVAYEIPGANPEGVGVDARNCSFYTAGSIFRGEVYRGRLDKSKADLFLAPEGDRHSAFGMEVDAERDLLFVVGGQNGVLYAYDLSDKKLHGRFETGGGGFLNEVTLAPNGDVYVTDSSRPILYRIKASDIEAGRGSPQGIPLGPEVVYGPGFNSNGVVVTPDGQHVVFALTNSGKLYRLTPGSGTGGRKIQEITIDRGPQASADGLEIDGQTIYLVRNRNDMLVRLTMSEDYSSATVAAERKDPLFRSPTSVSLAPDGRLLIAVAEYFNSDGPPYYVLSVKRP